MTDDFSRYAQMKLDGSSPEEVWRAAMAHGLDEITRYRMIRSVFALDLVGAKEVAVRVAGARDLAEHQAQFIDDIRRLVEDDDDSA